MTIESRPRNQDFRFDKFMFMLSEAGVALCSNPSGAPVQSALRACRDATAASKASKGAGITACSDAFEGNRRRWQNMWFTGIVSRWNSYSGSYGHILRDSDRARVIVLKQLEATAGNIAETMRLLQNDVEDRRQIARRCVNDFENFGSCRLLLTGFV